MTPPIRYARTTDGVSIAFTELGAGPDVICLPPLPFSYVEEAWRLPGVAPLVRTPREVGVRGAVRRARDRHVGPRG
ncbi:MAG: hypothetical protein EXR66_01895 [Dehalococcoidia bacterium]|nr:hypothetical protein [Dehalococcoidia bacterium]